MSMADWLSSGRARPSTTRDPILRLYLNRATLVGKIAPHLISHRSAYLLRQCGKRLAGGRPTTLERAVIRVE